MKLETALAVIFGAMLVALIVGVFVLTQPGLFGALSCHWVAP